MEQLQMLFCFLVFIFMIHRKWKQSKATSSKQPPGPRKLPLVGNMLQLIGALPYHRLRDLANKYGPIMHLQLGQVSNIVISSPEAAKEAMKTQDTNFAHRPFNLAASIVFYNLQGIAFSPYGDHWRQMRKISILELLSAKRVQSFRSIREEEVLLLINSISCSAGSPIDLGKMLFFLTNSITLRTGFGKISRYNDEFRPLVEKIMLVLEGFSVADFFPSFSFLHGITGMRTKLERLHKEVDAIIENIIKEHRENKTTHLKDEEDDLVDVLLNLQDHGDLEFPLTTDNIKAIMLEMFLAGTETTSTAIEWAMSEMIKNPRVMERAQAEVRQVFNQRQQQVVDERGLEELKYLKLVIKETLRLHPPAPLLIPRQCRERVEINGYEIPANTNIMVNAWAIGRDPRYWKEAEILNPERFLNSSIDYKGKDFEFIPFGAGRRICPGMTFGMAIVELSLANLLYHFDWNLPSGSNDLDMSESFGITTRRKNELSLIPIVCHP